MLRSSRVWCLRIPRHSRLGTGVRTLTLVHSLFGLIPTCTLRAFFVTGTYLGALLVWKLGLLEETEKYINIFKESHLEGQ